MYSGVLFYRMILIIHGLKVLYYSVFWSINYLRSYLCRC